MSALNPPAKLKWTSPDDGESFTAEHDGDTWLLWRKPAWTGKRGWAKKSTWHLARMLADCVYDSDECRHIAPHRKSDLPRAKRIAAFILANREWADSHHLGDIEKAALDDSLRS
jgi:hypothetical protein